jgi:hypothetical protein
MDPISTLATSAVAILAPYLAQAGTELSKEIGKATLGKIGVLYETLNARFKKRSGAKEALKDLETEPNNQDVQAALRRQLTKEMNVDQTLVDTLQKLVDEINRDQPSRTFLTQVYGGEVGQIINAHRIDKITYNRNPVQRESAPKRRKK